MAITLERTRAGMLHPVHAVLLAGTIPLFLGALLSDVAYAKSYQIQWTNFASWLVAGGLVFVAVVLVFALVDLFRADRRADRRAMRQLVYFVVVLAMFVVGLVNALVHAKDAWAVMPGGLVLSAVVTLLACTATWLGFSGLRAGGAA